MLTGQDIQKEIVLSFFGNVPFLRNCLNPFKTLQLGSWYKELQARGASLGGPPVRGSAAQNLARAFLVGMANLREVALHERDTGGAASQRRGHQDPEAKVDSGGRDGEDAGWELRARAPQQPRGGGCMSAGAEAAAQSIWSEY